MTSDNYKERLVAEYQQLTIRLNALKEFVNAVHKGLFPRSVLKCPLTILEWQIEAMDNYKGALESRAMIEAIELDN